jgi:hypothetical protein
MSSTTTAVAEVRDLDPEQALSLIAASRRNADREEANLLAAVVTWVDLHPVTDQHPAATPRSKTRLCDAGSVEPPLGGVGTPGIAEFAVEELAAALGVGYPTGLQLVVEAVELCYRLPRLWTLVQAGDLQAWKARRVARETTGLSQAAVDFVDRHVATTGRRNQVPPLRAVIHEALLQCDPDQAAGVEQAALDARGVWFDHRQSTATTDLTARLDTLDALDLEGSISDLATTLHTLGDDRPLDVRRATALGLLAHPQRTLDLVTDSSTDTRVTAPKASSWRAADGLNGSRAVVYLHITSADLATWATGCLGGSAAGSVGGSVEALGPATLGLLRDWLQRTGSVTVRPVLDPARIDGVDQHDGPEWMRECVILRDKACVFPGCTVGARRCDLDHIRAYVPPDDGGPPEQTCVDNLACLCRRHHRLKTFTGWTYRRTWDGSYLWTSPRGRTYRVRRD